MIRADGRPDRVGPYRLVERLAAGGVADVYLGQNEAGGEYRGTVVVKMLRSDRENDVDMVDLFLRETRLLACLKHPNIVQQLDVVEQGGCRYQILEFVFGRTFRRLMDTSLELGTRFPVPHLRTILVDVLDALQFAHSDLECEGQSLSAVHRDVSPSNVIIGFDGVSRLLDFGMARAKYDTLTTQTGHVKGQFAYMAPEQLSPGPIDGRTDLFAVGILLWEALTGRRLFYRHGDYATIQAVSSCRVPLARAQNYKSPWRESWVARRALRKDPRARFRTAQAMRDALMQNDSRTREERQAELAAWMARSFERDLQLRARTLQRIRRQGDSLAYQKTEDAGMALIDEVTDPALPIAPVSRDTRLLEPMAADAPLGLSGLFHALFGSWRWLILAAASFLFFLSTAWLYVETGDPPKPSGFGYIHVKTPGIAAQVYVDDEYFGKAPVSRIALEPGRHLVRVKRPDGEERVQPLSVEAGEKRVIEIAF